MSHNALRSRTIRQIDRAVVGIDTTAVAGAVRLERRVTHRQRAAVQVNRACILLRRVGREGAVRNRQRSAAVDAAREARRVACDGHAIERYRSRVQNRATIVATGIAVAYRQVLQRERPACRHIEQPELRRTAATFEDRAIADDGDRRADRRQSDAVLRGEEGVGAVRQADDVERHAVGVCGGDGVDQAKCVAFLNGGHAGHRRSWRERYCWRKGIGRGESRCKSRRRCKRDSRSRS